MSMVVVGVISGMPLSGRMACMSVPAARMGTKATDLPCAGGGSGSAASARAGDCSSCAGACYTGRGSVSAGCITNLTARIESPRGIRVQCPGDTAHYVSHERRVL